MAAKFRLWLTNDGDLEDIRRHGRLKDRWVQYTGPYATAQQCADAGFSDQHALTRYEPEPFRQDVYKARLLAHVGQEVEFHHLRLKIEKVD